MPSLRETLELLVTANVGGAVSSFDKLGSAAEKNLGKTDDRLQRVSGTMTKVGAGMVGFGVLATGTFAHFASSAGEAEQAQLRLDNAVANSSKMAGQSSAAFVDLASALQKTTVFDDDATKTMMAHLVATGRTKDEVLALTPAVQDLAVKTGSLDSAASAVTIALNGKKRGLEALVGPLDEALYKTDRYAAVTEALTRVLGLAAEQGKTYQGQVAILKNLLGELSETVGRGATSAFEDLLGPVVAVVDRLGELDPSVLESAGRFGALGSIAVTAAGSLAVMGGQIYNLREGFTKLGEDGTRSLTKLGQAAAFGSAAFGVAALAILAFQNRGVQMSGDFQKVAGAFSQAADREIIAAVNRMKTAFGGDMFTGFIDKLKALGPEGAGALQAMSDAMRRAGQDTTVVDKAIADMATTQKSANQAAAEGAQVLDDLGGAADDVVPPIADVARVMGDARDAIKAADDAQKNLSNTLKAATDPFFAMTDAGRNLADSQRTVTEKQAELDKAIRKHGANSAEAITATRELDDANINAIESASNFQTTMMNLSAEIHKNPEAVGQAITVLENMRQQGIITGAQFDTMKGQIVEMAGQAAALDGTNMRLAVSLDASQAEATLRQLLTDVGDYAALARETFSGTSGASVSGSTPPPVRSGAPVFHAAGGMAATVSSPAWINVAEPGVGPEDVLIVPHSKGGIANGQSMAMAGGGSQPIVVQLVLGEKVVQEVAIDGFISKGRRNGSLAAAGLRL